MDINEFKRRVDHNTKILRKALSAKTKIVTILDDLYTYQTKPGQLSSQTLLRKGTDILPACYLGFLANVDSTGADAFCIDEDDKTQQVELKTSEVNGDAVWVGPRLGLYTGTPGRNTKLGLESRLCATYTIHSDDNKKSKKMRTFLLIADARIDGFIDAFEMDGRTIMRKIQKTRCHKRTIKLSEFINYGKRSDCVVDMMGYDTWRSMLAKECKKWNEV